MYNENGMLHITKDEYDSTPDAYQGSFIDFFGHHPEYRGRKTLMPPLGDESGHHTTTLLVEGVGFVIEN